MTQTTNDYFYIEPKVRVKSPETNKLTREKTALYIPTRIRNQIKFSKSKHFDNVYLNHDVKAILKAITLHSKIKHRYSIGNKKGLEDDFSKQQIIIYTAILNKGYVLMYYRAREKDNQIVKVNVDPRLGGQYSIGFGGHTADKDRLEAILSIEGFKDLLPALFPELAMVMSTTKARVTEMYEELGLEPQDFKYLKLLGTFYLKFAPKQLIKGSQESVHAVHTAVAAVAEINEQTIGDKSLKLPRSEFGGAEWVKLTNLVKTFTDIEKAGGTVEKWSWILAKDFLDKKY